MNTDELAGQIRSVQRGLDELSARVVVHEAGHAGVRLPDVVSWAKVQWTMLNPGAKQLIMLYLLMALVALGRWLWGLIVKRSPKTYAVTGQVGGGWK